MLPECKWIRFVVYFADEPVMWSSCADGFKSTRYMKNCSSLQDISGSLKMTENSEFLNLVSVKTEENSTIPVHVHVRPASGNIRQDVSISTVGHRLRRTDRNDKWRQPDNRREGYYQSTPWGRTWVNMEYRPLKCLDWTGVCVHACLSVLVSITPTHTNY